MPAPFSLVSSVISYVLVKRACGRAWLLLVGGLGSGVKSPAGVKSSRRRGAGVCPSRHTSVASLVVGSVVDAELLTG